MALESSQLWTHDNNLSNDAVHDFDFARNAGQRENFPEHGSHWLCPPGSGAAEPTFDRVPKPTPGGVDAGIVAVDARSFFNEAYSLRFSRMAKMNMLRPLSGDLPSLLGHIARCSGKTGSGLFSKYRYYRRASRLTIINISGANWNQQKCILYGIG